VLTLLGVVARRQGDQVAAQKAFAAAVSKADKMLALTAENYDALDAKGLALCGLVLCLETEASGALVQQAIDVFHAARTIITAPGVVTHVLRLFDALALVDTEGRLGSVRTVIARE
jgi:hypothetical protein